MIFFPKIVLVHVLSGGGGDLGEGGGRRGLGGGGLGGGDGGGGDGDTVMRPVGTEDKFKELVGHDLQKSEHTFCGNMI